MSSRLCPSPGSRNPPFPATSQSLETPSLDSGILLCRSHHSASRAMSTGCSRSAIAGSTPWNAALQPGDSSPASAPLPTRTPFFPLCLLLITAKLRPALPHQRAAPISLLTMMERASSSEETMRPLRLLLMMVDRLRQPHPQEG